MKSIFKSKTFWFNVLATAATYGNVLPPKYGIPVATVGNIGLRFLTTAPVSLTGK